MKAIVLAAGKGTRLNSEAMELPKALRMLHGRPLIRYVLDHLDFLAPEDIAIVVGYRKEQVIETIGGGYRFVEQPQPYNGTAMATRAAMPVFGNTKEPILVCYCDMPFLRRETYRQMFDAHIASGAGGTLLAGIIDPPPPFGRLVRDEAGVLLDVIEESACTPEQRKIQEVNIGIQVLDGARLWGWLDRIDNDNPKREYYLTGIVRVLAREGVPQTVVQLEDHGEMLGVNTEADLAEAEARLAGGEA